MTRRITIEKRDYSRGAWRLIDSETGCEVTVPEWFEHPSLGWMELQRASFNTKQEAIDALGMIAAQSLPKTETAA